MAYSKTIYDIFADIATEIGVNYDFGSFKELQKRLFEKTKSSTDKGSKYPLLCLVTPVPELKNPSAKYISTVTVHLLLLAETRKEWTTKQRLDNNFIPILYPLFDSLVEQLQSMTYFDTNEFGLLEMEYVDLFHYSSTEAKEQNKFAAVLDAVEITNLKLNLLPQNCI